MIKAITRFETTRLGSVTHTHTHTHTHTQVRADDQGYHPLRNDTAWLCSDDCKASFERVVARLKLDEKEMKKSTDNDGKIDGIGGCAASRKRPAACSACATRKVKCKHYQNEGADAGSSGQIGGEGSRWICGKDRETCKYCQRTFDFPPRQYQANLANHEKACGKK